MSRKVHTYEGKRISVTWEGARCTHAAECLRWLPDAFSVDQRPWVQPNKADADAVAEAVMLCPTGALHFTRHDGGDEEPKSEENIIGVVPDGPLYVWADAVLCTSENDVLLRDTRIALCRCGQSRNKPFCDNSHRLAHFRDPGSIQENKLVVEDPAPDTTQLTITAKPDGPLRFRGPMAIRLPDGTEIFGHRVSLCRCGQSKNKPFCDATHKEIGFDSDNAAIETQVEKEVPTPPNL